MTRRDLIKSSPLVFGTAMTGGLGLANQHKSAVDQVPGKSFRHSVARWCFGFIELEALCEVAVDIGLSSIELTGPAEWEVMERYGLTCAMGWDQYPDGVTLDNFMANPDNHEALVGYYSQLIPIAARAGVANVIALSGQRQGRSDYENLIHCKRVLDKVLPIAKDHDVTISMEILNSRIDHPDHQFDNMRWGVTLCDMMDSEHFKILYDIYHAQIMEGDVVRTIRQYQGYISHYHTAGVPGRHHIDDGQELNYRFIMKAIKDTGYRGFIGQEFIPAAETDAQKVEQLREAVQICEV